MPGVHALHEHHARILTQSPVEEPAPNVHGVDAGRAALQQHVGEATGRSADVGADPTFDADAELVQGWGELSTAAADVRRWFDQLQARVRLNRAVRGANRLAVDADLSRQDQRLGSGPRLRQACLGQRCIQARPAWLQNGSSPTATPRAAPIRTSTGVWPSSSRTRYSWMPRMAKTSSTRRLRTAAWRPAARRTP